VPIVAKVKAITENVIR